MTTLHPEEDLDRQFDELLEDHPLLAAADTATIATLEQMVHAATSPAPDPVFVQRLGESLHDLPDDVVTTRSLNHFPRTVRRQFGDHVRVPLPRTAAEPGLDRHTTQAAGSPSPLPTHQERSQDEGITPRRARAILRSVWPALTAAAVILLLLTSYLSLVSPQRATPPEQLVAIHEPGVAAPERLRISVAGIDADIVAQAPGPLAPQGSILNAGWLDDAAHTMDDENATDSFSWLQGSAAPDEHGNVVLQWDGNPAETDPERFQAVRRMRAGDRIEITTGDDTIMAYRVASVRVVPAVSDASWQQDIGGPTPRESLTLVAGKDALDAATGQFAQALVVRAEFAGATPPWRIIRPDAAQCPAATRTIAELEEIAAGLASQPVPRPPLLDAGAEVVSPVKLQLITATLEALVACFNANDPLRAYALFTDDGLEQMMRRSSYGLYAVPEYEWTPDFSVLATPAVARPFADRFALVAMEDVRILPDGRFAARVTIAKDEDSDMPLEDGVLGISAGYPVTYIFAPYADMRIDDFVTE